MTGISQHIPNDLIRAYAAGQLPHAFSTVVAAHVSLCDECNARLGAEEVLAGATLDRLPGVALAEGARDRALAALDGLPPAPPPIRGSGIYPAPVVQAMGGRAPAWRPLGGGIRQQILAADDTGTLRLLYIPPGRAVPEHGHRGLEMTLVLQGSFSDSGGSFSRGDVEVAHDEIDHQPMAGEGDPCICLAATDSPLRFRGMIPRVLQPLFRI